MKRVDEMPKKEEYREWTSSKGNQKKWFRDGVWYKEDSLGYEALSEVVISRLLEKTNIDNFVRYEYTLIDHPKGVSYGVPGGDESLERDSVCRHGCMAWDFLELGDDKLVSVERLFQAYKGESAARGILAFTQTEEKIRYVVNSIEEITGLENFGEYLRKILTIDALFLNEDRHFHNLAVILRKDGTYRECPIFDNGASLFSDIKGDYSLNMDLEECFRKIEAKPFSREFDEQLDACEMLYGGFSFQANFTSRDVEEVLAEFKGIYEEKILERIYEVMRLQLRKYAYLW